MKCPYRLDTQIEYATIGNTIVKDAERAEFPDCYEMDCPLYNVLGVCERAEKEAEE